MLSKESETAPPPAIVEKVAGECGVAPERLTILFAPIRSLAGSVQVVARVVEVALHKAHELKFPIERIVDAWLVDHPEHPALPHLEEGAVEGEAGGHDHDHDHGAHDHDHDHDHGTDAVAAPPDPTATDQPTDVPARAG